MLQLPKQWVKEEYLPRVQRKGREKTIPLRHPFMNTLSPYSALKVLSWITASRNFKESHESFGGLCRWHLVPWKRSHNLQRRAILYVKEPATSVFYPLATQLF